MSDMDVLPELKEIVGAILFASKQPVTPAQIRKTLQQTAQLFSGVTQDYAKAAESDVAAAIEAVRAELSLQKLGFRVVEIAGGFRLENQPSCGPWLRALLDKGRPSRLTPPALETLAIVAFRQPITRAEIEAVRGVAVDQLLRNLLELQLVRILGRSDAPGRPWLFGTTQKFLEHFGLRSLDDLPGVDELRRLDAARKAETAPVPAADEPPPPAFHPAARTDSAAADAPAAPDGAQAGDPFDLPTAATAADSAEADDDALDEADEVEDDAEEYDDADDDEDDEDDDEDDDGEEEEEAK